MEVRDLINDHPGQTSTKVNSLVHNEAHDTRGKDIILHVRIPTLWTISKLVAAIEGGRLTAQRRSKILRWTLYLESSS